MVLLVRDRRIKMPEEDKRRVQERLNRVERQLQLLEAETRLIRRPR